MPAACLAAWLGGVASFGGRWQRHLKASKGARSCFDVHDRHHLSSSPQKCEDGLLYGQRAMHAAAKVQVGTYERPLASPRCGVGAPACHNRWWNWSLISGYAVWKGFSKRLCLACAHAHLCSIASSHYLIFGPGKPRLSLCRCTYLQGWYAVWLNARYIFPAGVSWLEPSLRLPRLPLLLQTRSLRPRLPRSRPRQMQRSHR